MRDGKGMRMGTNWKIPKRTDVSQEEERSSNDHDGCRWAKGEREKGREKSFRIATLRVVDRWGTGHRCDQGCRL